MAHSNPVRRYEFPPLAGCHHPALAFREPFFPVAKAPVRTRLGPLAFDRQYGLPPVGDNEVHLAPIGIAKELEVEIKPLGILPVVDPLQQMRGDQVFEPRTAPGNQ